jgi:hypothetical protein
VPKSAALLRGHQYRLRRTVTLERDVVFGDVHLLEVRTFFQFDSVTGVRAVDRGLYRITWFNADGLSAGVRNQRRRGDRRPAQRSGAAYGNKAEPGAAAPNSWLARSMYLHGIPPQGEADALPTSKTDTFLGRLAGGSRPC